MKKIMILVIGALLLLVGSSVALMSKPDLVDTAIQIPPNITNVTYVLPPEPRFMNCTANFSFTVPTPVVIPPGFLPVNWTIENNTDGTPFIVPPGYPWVAPILPVYYLEDHFS